MSWTDRIPGWIEATEGRKIPPGLNKKDALRRARELRDTLRNGTSPPSDFRLDDESANVLYGLCALLRDVEEPPEVALRDARAAYSLISRIDWPSDAVSEREELLRWCLELGLRDRTLSSSDDFKFLAAERVLATPISERAEKASDLQLEDPETILTLIGRLWERMEGSPATIRDDAEFLYRFLEKPKRPIGLFDEREYFLAELALVAGTACRHLSRRKEARLWFDRSEAWFLHVIHPLPHFSRVTYQRLTVRMEERQLEEVMKLLPTLSESFVKLEMAEAALKCRFIEGAVLLETGKLREALAVFRDISQQGEQFRNEKLLASAYVNLAQIHSELGESEEAMVQVHKAAPLLRRLNDRIALAKLQWGVAELLRKQGQVDCDIGNMERGEARLASAIEAYRAAQNEFAEIGMKADVAALHLVVADLLLDAGKDHQARREIQAALPVIDELELASAGFAAYSLLRKSLENHSINRQALRDLHGYFEDRD